MYTEDSLNNSGEVEEERANLLPKKLGKAKMQIITPTKVGRSDAYVKMQLIWKVWFLQF